MKRTALPILILAAAGLIFWWVNSSSSAELYAPLESSEPPAQPESSNASLDRDPVSRAVADRVRFAPRPISGMVIGPDDQPISAAAVTLYEVLAPWPRRDRRRIDSGYTGADGRFLFRVSSEFDVLVEVTREGLARTEIAIPEAVTDLQVRLEHGFKVTGFVRDQFGKLVGGCDVYLEPGRWAMFHAMHTRTDPNTGQFVFSDVPAGVARVAARSDYYQPATAPSVTIGSDVRVSLEFRSVSRVTMGRVVEAASGHRPVAGAEIRVYPGTWNGGLFEPILAVTDGTGRFKMRGLGEGNLRFEVHHPEYSIASRDVSVRPGRDELVLELVGRSTVSGQLDGGDTAGLALRIENSLGELSRTIVAADGSFRFPERLSVGLALLEIERGRRGFASKASRFLYQPIEEQAETRMEATLVSATVVRGRVVDGVGAPIAQVVVSTPRPTLQPLQQRSPDRYVAVTDANGDYEFRGLAGSNTLEFAHDDFASSELSVAVTGAGETVQVESVVLVPAGRLEGRVTRGGAPLAGATVFAGMLGGSMAAVSGPDGRFVIRRLAPRGYRLKARYSTMPVMATGDAVEIFAGQTTKSPDIVIPSGRRISGKLTERTGKPIANALVCVTGAFGATTSTDSFGLFELDVTEDAQEVLVYSPDFTVHETRPIPAARDDDEPTEMFISMAIAPRSTVRARVLGLPSRKPVSNGVMRVFANRKSETWDPAMASQRDIPARVVEMANGALVADWFPVGTSTLTLQCQGFAPLTLDVSVNRRDPCDLGTILLEPGAAIFGVLVDAGGTPIPSAEVYLGEVDDGLDPTFQPLVVTDAAGRFTLQGVTPDSRRVIAMCPGYAMTIVEVKIPRDLLRQAGDPLRIVMHRASRIRVNVRDAAGNRTDTRVVQLCKGPKVLREHSPNSDGDLEFRAPGAGTFTIKLFGEEVEQIVEVGEMPQEYVVALRSTH